MRTKTKTENRGQTLIEVMIALFALTAGFLGIMALLAQSVYVSKAVSTETTATYLAAEGIELAKNIIDHDVYQRLAGLGTGWGTAFSAGGDFELDYATCNNLPGAATPCNPPLYSGVPLRFDPATNRYSYSGPIATGFTRKITVTPNGANEIVVVSTVRWAAGGAAQSAVLEDHFYNWHL